MKIAPLLLTLSLLPLIQPAQAERAKKGQTQFLPETPQAPKAKIVADSPTPPASASPGILNKLWPFGGKPAAAPVPPPAPPPVKLTKKGKLAESPKAPPAPPTPPVAAPEEKGLLGKIWPFGKKPEPTAPEPKIVKTKTATATKTSPLLAKSEPPKAPEAAPEKKPGFLAKLFAPVESKNDSKSVVPESSKQLRPENWETRAVVTDSVAAAYIYGPSQPFADARLERGTMVTMKTRGKDWSEVVLEDGRTMTVGSDQIRMAEKEDFRDPPPPPVAANNPALPAFMEPTLETYQNVPEQGPALLPSSGELLLTPAKP